MFIDSYEDAMENSELPATQEFSQKMRRSTTLPSPKTAADAASSSHADP